MDLNRVVSLRHGFYPVRTYKHDIWGSQLQPWNNQYY